MQRPGRVLKQVAEAVEVMRMDGQWRRRVRAGSCDGLSLVEVMVGMAVFVVGSLALLSAFTSGLRTTSDSRLRVLAANLAAADIDEARSLSYAALTTATYTKTVDGRTFTVTRSVAPALSSGVPSACSAGGSRQQTYKRVSTRVDATFREKVAAVRADTLVVAPVYDPSSTVGALGASVVDRDGQPVPGVAITVNGTSVLTDETGCAFVDGLPPATLPVSAGRTGYVDRSGAASTTTSTGFTAGQVSRQTFELDVPARVSVVPSVLSGSTALTGYALPAGLVARLETPDRATSTRTAMTPQAVTASGASLTWDAYPAVAGYDTWLGSCAAVQHVPSVRDGVVSPGPALPLVPVDVTITGDPVKAQGQSITATWAEADCSESLTWAATTDAAGAGQIAVPPGTWTLAVVGRAGTSRTVTLTAGSPSAQTWPVTW